MPISTSGLNETSETSSRRRRAVLRVAISGLLVLGLVGALSSLQSFSWASFWASLGELDARWVLAAMGVSLIQVALQLIRLWIVFKPEDRPPTWELHSANLIGQTLNALAPLRSGDAYKLLKLTAQGAPLEKLTAALVVERVADTLALFLLSGASAISLARLIMGRLTVEVFVSAATVGGIAALLVALTRTYWSTLPGFIQTGVHWLEQFMVSTRSTMFSRRFIYCFLVSCITWAFDAATLMCSARAGEVDMDGQTAMLSIFALNMGIAIPLSVANAGVFEVSLSFAMQAAIPDLGMAQALSIATLEHAAKIGGLIGLLAIGAGWLLLRRRLYPEAQASE